MSNLQDKCRFSSLHTKICLLTWTTSVLYACYHFTKNCQKYFENHHDYYEDFSGGWSLLGTNKQDNADFEWKTIRKFIYSAYPYLICYTVLTKVAFSFVKVTLKMKKFWIVSTALIGLTFYFGPKGTVIVMAQPLVFYVLDLIDFDNKLYLWCYNIMCLAVINFFKQLTAYEDFLHKLGLNYFQAYLLVIILFWMNLKCISFSFSGPKSDFLDLCSYVLYLPLLFTGPFVTFKNFKPVLRSEGVNFTRLKLLGTNLLRISLWVCLLEVSLHFIYVNAAGFQVEFVSSLPFKSLCGYGYLMGQYFHIKYVILYGLSTSLASFDGATVPRMPRCIGRVHLYSDMWKYFDPGLYEFLKETIYIPALKRGLPKTLCMFLSFLFVYVWHGLEICILIWASMNFLGLLIENLALYLYKLHLKRLGSDIRTLKCLLATPLLALSAISNFYFFAGKEIGNVFLYRTLTEDLWKQALMFAAVYCCCQVSEELRDLEARRM